VAAVVVSLVVSTAGPALGRGGGPVHVEGYTRKDGTYVAPHYRSAPDGSFENNWSTKGNTNPYTGEAGTKVSPPAREGGYADPIPSPAQVDPSMSSTHSLPVTDPPAATLQVPAPHIDPPTHPRPQHREEPSGERINQDNLRTCLRGNSSTFCRHDLLTPAQRAEVREAESR